MTILSTDLKALKRRGYNGTLFSKHYALFWFTDRISLLPLVDRILRQQKAEREAAERAHRASLISSSGTVVDQDTQTKIPATETKVLPLGSATKPSTQTIGASLEQILKRPGSAISDFGRLLRHNRSNTSSRLTSPRVDDATQSSILDSSGASSTSTPNMPQGGSLRPSTGQGPIRNPNSGGPNVTPLSNICTFCGPDVPKW